MLILISVLRPPSSAAVGENSEEDALFFFCTEGSVASEVISTRCVFRKCDILFTRRQNSGTAELQEGSQNASFRLPGREFVPITSGLLPFLGSDFYLI